jgi:hypothetical protein
MPKPQWNWNWALEDKFEVICTEFGGEYTRRLDGSQRLVCHNDDYDNFIAFSQWLTHNKPNSSSRLTLLSSLMEEPDYRDDFFIAEFSVTKEEKKLNMSLSKDLYSDYYFDYVDDKIKEILPESTLCATDLIIDFNEIEKDIQKITEKSDIGLEVKFGGAGDVFIQSSLSRALKENQSFIDVFKEAETTLETVHTHAKARFFKGLDEEIARNLR